MSNIPDITSEYAQDYKQVNVAGIFGGARPYGVAAVLYSESMDVSKVLETQPLSLNKIVVKRIAECELVIDPMQMKSIHKWLGEKIAEYEKLFGQIRSPEEVGSRAKHGKDHGQ